MLDAGAKKPSWGSVTSRRCKRNDPRLCLALSRSLAWMISMPHPPRPLIPAHMKTLFIPMRTPPPRRSKTGDVEPLHVLVHDPVSRLGALSPSPQTHPPVCRSQSGVSLTYPSACTATVHVGIHHHQARWMGDLPTPANAPKLSESSPPPLPRRQTGWLTWPEDFCLSL